MDKNDKEEFPKSLVKCEFPDWILQAILKANLLYKRGYISESGIKKLHRMPSAYDFDSYFNYAIGYLDSIGLKPFLVKGERGFVVGYGADAAPQQKGSPLSFTSLNFIFINYERNNVFTVAIGSGKEDSSWMIYLLNLLDEFMQLTGNVGVNRKMVKSKTRRVTVEENWPVQFMPMGDNLFIAFLCNLAGHSSKFPLGFSTLARDKFSKHITIEDFVETDRRSNYKVLAKKAEDLDKETEKEYKDNEKKMKQQKRVNHQLCLGSKGYPLTHNAFDFLGCISFFSLQFSTFFFFFILYIRLFTRENKFLWICRV